MRFTAIYIMEKTPPAKFMSVSDITLQASPDLHGVMIRTIGRLHVHDYDVQQNLVWIQDPKISSHKLAIDCSRIAPIPFQDQHGLLYQFIGEIQCNQDKPAIIKALLYRCCEGLDIDVYIQAYSTIMHTANKKI